MIRVLIILLCASSSMLAQGKVKVITSPTDSVVFDSSRIEIFNNKNNIYIGKDAGRISATKNTNIAIGILAQGSNSEGNGNVSIGHNSLQYTSGTRNVSVGNYSGYNLTTGYRNVLLGQSSGHHSRDARFNSIVGDDAAFYLRDGYNNNILGARAGSYLNDGHSNVLVGYESGLKIWDGIQNVHLGNHSGQENTGDRNVMIGQGAGAFNYNSNYNVYMGMHAGRNVDSSDYNVMIGPFAGENYGEGDFNILIGHLAGRNASGSHQLIIDNTDTPTPLIYGDFLNDKLTINGQLNVGPYSLPNSIAGVGSYLKLNTDSTSIWGLPSINDLTDGMNGHNDNLFLGYTRDTLAGRANIAIGDNSLGELNGSNSSNSQNVGVGFNALDDLINGSNNTGIGYWSMQRMEEGDGNTALGNLSLPYLVTGYSNTGIGSGVGSSMRGGIGNTLIGQGAGNSSISHTKNYSVHIGYSAGYNDTSDYKLHIGSGWPSKTLIYGDFANDSVRINGVLQIKDEYTFPDGKGSYGEVLIAADNGNTEFGNLPWIKDYDEDTYIATSQTYTDDDVIRFHINNDTVASYAIFKNQSDIPIFFINDNNNYNAIFNSGAANMAASGNTYMGYGSGYQTTSGSNNTFLGLSAGATNTTGSGNIMIGGSSGYGVSGGNYNIYIGEDAGAGGGIASGQICIGRQAGNSDNRPNTLTIENKTTVSDYGTPPLIWGDFANDSIRLNAVLQIGNEYAFPTHDGSNGQILSTDGNGQVSWVNNDLLPVRIEDSDMDTYITVESSNDSDIIEMYTQGFNQMTLNSKTISTGSPGNSLFIGVESGLNDNDNDNQNTFVGPQAGRNNETGQENVFIGFETSFSNVDGTSNTSVGHQAGRANVNGNNNVSIGQMAGLNNLSNANLFVGRQSGEMHQMGDGNVMIGHQAGKNHQQGEGNIFIGNRAGADIQGDHHLVIDNQYNDRPLISGKFDDRMVNINWSPADSTNVATVNINATLKLKPITNPPVCNGDTVGLMYFDLDADKLKVCTSAGYVDLH